jgi:signal transduction histidine kinase/CheY-like chemotaxis protein
MIDFSNYLLAVLGEFGSGRGDPSDEYVRFGLGSVFFFVLFIIALRSRKGDQKGRETYLAIGFGLGLSREAFKFVIKSLEIHGGVDTAVLELFFPPLEHALFFGSRLFIAAGFIHYFLDAERLANRLLAAGGAFILVYYAIVAPLWWSYVAEMPTIKFSHVLADWIIHVAGLALGAFAVAVILMSDKPGRYIVGVVFFAFLMDDLLQLVNLGTGEVYKTVFGPIRHNLHIWGIALFGYVYLREHTLERQRLEKRLKTAIRIAGIGNFSFDFATRTCTYCSEQYAANFGLTPDVFIAKTAGPNPDLTYVHEDDRHIIETAIKKLSLGETQSFEYRALHPERGVRYITEIVEPVFGGAGKVVANVGTSIDLTDQREAEVRVRQSQRIEAIGTLTGGVAHDFNNLLAVILGNLELSLETESDEDRKALIQSAIKASLRGAGLTKNLLSFARRAHLEPTRLNLNQTVHSTMNWASRILPETIKIENSMMAGLWDVKLDATSVENAIINLLLNARDAMPDGGRVTIETSNMRIGDEYISDRHEDIEPGRYVMLAISDTGTGIPEDKLDKVFEPFYTGKPVGQGSGLGLSMVQGFIKQSGGAIRLYSEVGTGTTVKLYFKAAEGSDTNPQVESCDAKLTPDEQVEILVVEDEAEVLRVLIRVLESVGYGVTSATSGDEALDLFKSGGGFDLLMTDVVMPGELQGPALARSIREIDPDLPCIFLSGYAAEATVHGNGLKPADIRLMKPVSRLDLLRAVSKALARPRKQK